MLNAAEEILAVDGEYLRFYETLGPIGNGAFGFVKMAKHRNEDHLVSGEMFGTFEVFWLLM